MSRNLKKILLIFGILTPILSFLSCSFLGSNDKKYPEGSLEWLKKQGVNTEQLFEFKECEATYNGKPFTIGNTIEHMVYVFGPYSRIEGGLSPIYIWDDLGMIMAAFWPGEEPSTKVNTIFLYWNMEKIPDYMLRSPAAKRLRIREEIEERTPKQFFQGKVLMDGVPLGRGMSIRDYRARESLFFRKDRFGGPFYNREMRYCPSRDLNVNFIYMLEYSIRISGDNDDIESLSFSAVYRNQ